MTSRLRTLKAPTLTLERAPAVATGTLLAAAVAWILFIGRDSQFWSDDFAFVVFRQGHAPSVFLDNFNGHFALFPVAIYKVLLALFGMHHYWPYRVVVAVVHVATLTVVFLYVRRRAGGWAAFLGVALLVIYGAAVELYVYPVNIGFQLALLTGIGALLLLDEPTTRRRAIAATVLLTIGIASSTVSLAFLVAVIVDVARRTERRALWWVPAIPAAVYVLWSLKYGESQLVWKNLGQLWGYPMHGIGRSLGGLVALDETWGTVLAVATLALILWRATTVDRLVALVAGLLGFWVLTAMARAQLGTEGAERFLYPSSVLIVIIWAELARGVRMPARMALVAPVAVIGIVLANGFSSYSIAENIADIGQTTSGGLRALAVDGAGASSTVVPSLPYYGANAAQLSAVVRKFGAPGGSPRTLASASPQAKIGADTILRAIAAAAGPAGATAPSGAPRPTATTAATTSARGGCLTVKPTGAGATVALQVPATGLVVQDQTAPVTIDAQRFAPFSAQPDFTVAPGPAQRFGLTAAPGTQPWNARLSSTAPFAACAPAAG